MAFSVPSPFFASPPRGGGGGGGGRKLNIVGDNARRFVNQTWGKEGGGRKKRKSEGRVPTVPTNGRCQKSEKIQQLAKKIMNCFKAFSLFLPAIFWDSFSGPKKCQFFQVPALFHTLFSHTFRRPKNSFSAFCEWGVCVFFGRSKSRFIIYLFLLHPAMKKFPFYVGPPLRGNKHLCVQHTGNERKRIFRNLEFETKRET